MNILQHYYTSFLNQTTGTSGFQVKAMSPGISSETQNLILRLISYRIPSGLDERAPTTHPCALRYYPGSQNESLLICSQSIGEDPNGRPGNFFAHTLVVSPEIFTTVPPVLYWKSPFWLTADPLLRSHLGSLCEFPADPALHSERIWNFLHARGRLSFFAQLMSAVVQGTGRRIMIVDSDEHTALWIAAISCLLPPAYRPLLSFTTYHHDPYQSLFFITGVSPSAGLRLTPEDYISYFILNAHEERVSEIALSPYACLAQRFATPGHDENELLTFFSRYAQRFPPPAVLDDRLDLMVSYAQIMQGARECAGPYDLQAIELVLPTFAQSFAPGRVEIDPQDLADLQRLAAFLWQTYEVANERAAHRLLDRVVALLQNARAPTGSIFEKQLLHHTTHLLQTPPEQNSASALPETLTSIEQLRETYGPQEFRQQVNRAEYLRTLSALSGQSQCTQLTYIWMSIGPDLLPIPETKGLLVHSIQAWNSARHTELWQTLDAVLRLDRSAWLGLLVSPAPPRIDAQSAGAFYCACVGPLSLAQREVYREILRPLLPEVTYLEVCFDLHSSEVQMILPTMHRWLAYVREAALAESSSAVLASGLESLSQAFRLRPQEWTALAHQFLADSQLSHLLDDTWVARLFAAACAQLSLASFNPQQMALSQQYAHHLGLPERSRLILRTCLAMARQEIEEQDVAELSHYLLSLSPKHYTRELHSFCQVFFTPRLSDEQHLRFLTVFYCIHQDDTFWSLYWSALFSLPAEVTVRLLAGWFTGQGAPQPAITRNFLCSFWNSLLIYRKQASAQKTFELLKQCPWYQALEQGSLVHKHTLLTRGQDLWKLMSRRLPHAREGTEEKARHDLLEKTRPLFARGELRRNHRLLLLEIAGLFAAALFWDVYGECISSMLSDADAPQILEFFSFWFDDALPAQSQIRPLACCFLVNLPAVLEQAATINTALLTQVLPTMEQMANRADAPYPWYSLVKSLLAPPPTRPHPEQASRQARGKEGDNKR